MGIHNPLNPRFSNISQKTPYMFLKSIEFPNMLLNHFKNLRKVPNFYASSRDVARCSPECPQRSPFTFTEFRQKTEGGAPVKPPSLDRMVWK